MRLDERAAPLLVAVIVVIGAVGGRISAEWTALNGKLT
jgi:Flp pilus assembly pilin Flp